RTAAAHGRPHYRAADIGAGCRACAARKWRHQHGRLHKGNPCGGQGPASQNTPRTPTIESTIRHRVYHRQLITILTNSITCKINNMDNAKILILAALLSASCADKQQTYDASGTFETVETIISAEANGVSGALDIEEGQLRNAGQLVGYIDSTQLYLKKRQLEAQIDAVLCKKPDISTQLAALRDKLDQAIREQQRVANMAKADVATPKQLDDANAQVAIIKKQIAAQEFNLGINSSRITQEASPLEIQIAQLEDQLAKSHIVNPMEVT